MRETTASEKHCGMCQTSRPVGDFHRMSRSRDGLQSNCKDCLSVAARERKARPLGERAEANRARAVAEMAESGVKVCAACKVQKAPVDFTRAKHSIDGRNPVCKGCRKALKAAEYAQNKEAHAARNRAAYLANRDHRIVWQTEWKKANPDRVKSYGRVYYERNREKSIAYTYLWIAANPERASENFRRNNAKRRARKLGATIGEIDLAELWESQGAVCPLCGRSIDRSLRYPHPLSPSVDHIVPLSKGGSHEQSNLQWTHLVGNQRKGAKAP